MNTIFTFISFRIKQFSRSIREIGIPLFLILLLVTTGITFKILVFLSEVQGIEMGILSLIIIGSIHSTRKDTHFLKSLTVSQPLLFLAEYSLLLLPVSIVLFFLGKIEPAIYWQLGMLPVLLLPAGNLKNNKIAPLISLDKIPFKYFEIKLGLRKMFFGIVLSYFVALGCSFFIGTLILFSILLLMLLPTFFEYFEPKEMIVLEYEKGNFLKRKIFSHLFIFQIALLPHYLLFLFYHFEMWYLGLACFIGLSLGIIFSIVYKYASYRPNIPKMFSNTFQAVFLATLVMPGLVLASIGMIIYFWRKANKNLAYYYA
ncbi:MAG: hypothetical protein AB8H03_01375 [Saprospiraceae bacterium]